LSSIGYSHAESVTYLSDVLDSIILKDIVARHQIRNIDLLQRLVRYLMSETGTFFSAQNVSNVMAEEKRTATRETVYNYLAACEDAFLVRRVRRHDLLGREHLRSSDKVYLTDVGMREALLGNNRTRIDMVLENIVFNELERRGFEVGVGRLGRREIDFVGRHAGEVIYVQVAYLLASESTRQREFGVYALLPDNYPKYVVSMDGVDFSQMGIIHRNICDFLSDPGW
jgi:predicted AAA+ superfamily ATPase